jgi:HD domain
MEAAPPALTERFLAAVALAQEAHGSQRRTGTKIPYLAHLLVVTGLVIEDGGDEDQAIAAMLHDSVEDGGGRPMLERIGKEFGRGVAAIVEGCSDSVDGDPMEQWIEHASGATWPTCQPSRTTRSCVWRSPTRSTTPGRSCATTARKGTLSGPLSREDRARAALVLQRPGEVLRSAPAGSARRGSLRAVGELAWLVARDEAQHESPDARPIHPTRAWATAARAC